MKEKSDLLKAYLAGFDRYLKVVIHDHLFEIENSCFVKKSENVIPIYNIKTYQNY